MSSASLEEWASEAFRKRLNLHLQITDPVLDVRQKAFTLRSDALLGAIRMVRVAAAALAERDERLAQREGDGARV